MQALKLKDLENYNLFVNKDNKLIYSALMTEKHKITVTLKVKINALLLIQIFNSNQKQLVNIEIQHFENERILEITGDFKHDENYTVRIDQESAAVILDPKIGGILDEIYYSDDDDFGVTLSKKSIKFKLWSAPAQEVKLLFFDESQHLIKTEEPVILNSEKPGIWKTELTPEDIGLTSFENISYQYKINAYGKETTALDPYCKSMPVFNHDLKDKTGKAALIDLRSKKANPENFIRNYSNYKYIDDNTDLITYEVHVRDFTIQPNCINKTLAGTYSGLIKKIDYLKDLGITHIQLMPVNKAYTQNESDRSYTDKTSIQSNYNWGYDPMNYFTLEGRYSTNPEDPYCRIYEFKQMIQALHNAGIGVILDVVFNHTYLANTFENVAPGCFYRLKEDYSISGHTGAGATIESRRKQVGKFIIDVLKFFVKEYHIDGFRFDLMSFLDKNLMIMIREEVGKAYNPTNINELILQGEAWNFTDLKENAFIKTDFTARNIGIFNDSMRDALSGNFPGKGFINGNIFEISRLATAVIGGIKSYDSDCLPFNKDVFFDPYHLFSKQPEDCLNYISIHDGFTMWDKINLNRKDESKQKRLKLMKLAYSILLSSQGKIILHGGDEILRSKPLSDFDNEKNRAYTSVETDREEGTEFFHENSYSSNDYTNMFRWDRLTNSFSYYTNDLSEYVKGLIKLRRTYKAFRMNTAHDICMNLRFLDEDCKFNHPINSFHSYKLNELKIRFKNGPSEGTLYMAGEIHKNDANPHDNLFKLQFDKFGLTEILFSKTDIENFDLYKWNRTGNLNFKLIKTKGKWDYPDNSYSEFGHNSISPESVNDNFEAEIDLNIKDHKLIHQHQNINPKPYIAYIINNPSKTENSQAPKAYKKFLIVHNSSDKTQEINLNMKLRDIKWDILSDGERSGIKKMDRSSVEIINNILYVPGISSVILASV